MSLKFDNTAKMQRGGDVVEPEDTGIGRRIYDLRVEQDIQQGELANAVNLHQSVLNRIEKGTRPARDREVRDFASFFHVSADFLLGLEEARVSRPHILRETPHGFLLTSPEEILHIKKYRALDERGRRSVEDTLAREYEYVQPAAQARNA